MRTASPASESAGGKRRGRLKWVALGALALLGTAGAATGYWVHDRYRVADVLDVPVTEYTHAEYREDPSGRSVRHGRYDGRNLKLVRRDETHFDFEFTSADPHIAAVAFRNVDVSLMTVKQPEWVKEDPGLTRISLIDREWNRQQVKFAVAPTADEPLDNAGAWVEVSGGDGWEEANLTQAALAKNCLNAGLWEVLLSCDEGGGMKMYYQGWFTFPLGHYAEQFALNTGLDYGDWWYPLEHWQDPAGTVMNLDGLRTVQREISAEVSFNPDEAIAVAGEQVRKCRTTEGSGYVCWGDLIERSDVQFATFVPPGKYSHAHPWGNEYWRLHDFEGGVVREVESPGAPGETLHELELTFKTVDGEPQRLLIGGVDFNSLPVLNVGDYPKGFYMPMGIGVPPFYQTYTDLVANPPAENPYYSLLVDAADRWIDHHTVALDGPVMHRDAADPGLIHLYLLSYERHTLVAHFTIRLATPSDGAVAGPGPAGSQTVMGGRTLPSLYYLKDDVQFFPAGPEFQFPNQVRALEEYRLRNVADAGEHTEG